VVWHRGCLLATRQDEMLEGIAANLERYLDLVSFRQKLTAANVANAETPGYTTKDIDFQAEYRSAMGSPPTVTEVSSLPAKTDGNNVNLDREARVLAENALRFSVGSQLVRADLNAVRSAIHGGKNT
jgi:flagellar basal-body rod protein FlgB